MSLVVLTPPAQEPVSLAEVYDQLRLGVNLTQHPDDARLRRMIVSARERTQTETRRALIEQTLMLVLDQHECRGEIAIGSGSLYGAQGWADNWGLNNWLQPGAWIELQRPPLIEVLAVQYFDTANVLRSVDVADYRVNASRLVPRIEFVDGYTAPPTFGRSDAWSVTYTAGYPPSDTGGDAQAMAAANVPQTLKEVILLRIDQAYNARLPAEDMVIDQRIDSMLATYRIERV